MRKLQEDLNAAQDECAYPQHPQRSSSPRCAHASLARRLRVRRHGARGACHQRGCAACTACVLSSSRKHRLRCDPQALRWPAALCSSPKSTTPKWLSFLHSLLDKTKSELADARAECVRVEADLAARRGAAEEEAAAADRASMAVQEAAFAEHQRAEAAAAAQAQELKNAVAAQEAEHQACRQEFERVLKEAEARSTSPADVAHIMRELAAASAVAYDELARSQATLFEFDKARNDSRSVAAGAACIAKELRVKLAARESDIAELERRAAENTEQLATAEARYAIVQEQAARMASENKALAEGLAATNAGLDETNAELMSERRANAELNELIADASVAGGANSAAMGKLLLEGAAALAKMFEGLRCVQTANDAIAQTMSKAAAFTRNDAPAAAPGAAAGAARPSLLLASLTARTSAADVTAALTEIGELAAVPMHRGLVGWVLAQSAAQQAACAFMLVLDKLGVQCTSAQARVEKMARCMAALRSSANFADAFAAIPAAEDRGDWRWKLVLKAMHAFLHRDSDATE